MVGLRANALAISIALAMGAVAVLPQGQDRTSQAGNSQNETAAERERYLQFSPHLVKPPPMQPRPTVPHESIGACPFECCTYREWTVERDTDVFGDYRTKTPVTFRLTRGQKVVAVTGVLVTTHLGLAVVTPTVAPESGFRAGDKLDVVHHESEGHWKYWFNGYFNTYPMHPTKQCHRVGAACEIEIVEEPRTIWWVKIRTPNAWEGWTHQPEHFGNKDACG